MNRIASPLCLSLLVSALFFTEGAALSPATPEQILCGQDYLFVGKAIKATPVRTPADGSSNSRNRVDLTIVVQRVIGTKKTGTSSYRSYPVLSPGDTIKATTYAVPFPYSSLGRFREQGGLYFTGPSNSVIPDDILIRAYLDEAFIYSGSYFTPSTEMSVEEWPLEKEDWIRKTMADYPAHGQPCASPL